MNDGSLLTISGVLQAPTSDEGVYAKKHLTLRNCMQAVKPTGC